MGKNEILFLSQNLGLKKFICNYNRIYSIGVCNNLCLNPILGNEKTLADKPACLSSNFYIASNKTSYNFRSKSNTITDLFGLQRAQWGSSTTKYPHVSQGHMPLPFKKTWVYSMILDDLL